MSMTDTLGAGVAEAISGAQARVLHNVIFLLGRQGLTWTLALALVAFVPHYLGDTGLGRITFATSVVAILLIFTDAGTGTLLTKQLALHPGVLSYLLWNAYALRLVLGIAIAGAAALFVSTVAMDGELRLVFYAATATLVVMSLDRAQVAALNGLELMRLTAMTDVASKLVLTVATVTALLSGFGLVTYAWIILAAALVSLAGNAAFLARSHLGRPRLDLRAMRWLVAGGAPFFLAGAVAQLYMWLDVTMLRAFTRDAVVGWYGAATQLYATLNVVPLVISTALLPALSRLHGAGEASVAAMTRAGAAAIIFTSMPMAFGLAIMAEDLIELLDYPAAFAHSGPLLALLAFSLPLTGLLMLTGTTAAALDQQSRWLRIFALAAGVNVVLNLALIPLFDLRAGNGAIGSASATLLSEGLQLVLVARLLRSAVLDGAVLTCLAQALGAALVMAAVVLGAKSALGLGLPAEAALGAAVYTLALVALGALKPSQIRGYARLALPALVGRRLPAAYAGVSE